LKLDWYSARELAGLPGMPRTVSGVIKKLSREKISSRTRDGKGGGREYPMDELPTLTQSALAKNEHAANLPAAIRPTGQDIQPAQPAPPISPAQTSRALLKAGLLSRYRDAVENAPWGRKIQAREDFMNAYNSGISHPNIYMEIGPLSWQTLEGWARRIKIYGGDSLRLADRRGANRRGRCCLTKQQTDVLLRCALNPNRPRIDEAIRSAISITRDLGIDITASTSTCRRWLENWRDRNYHVWVFTREGANAWNDKVAPYIERDYSLINVGDIIVADGHSLNFEIINPWTGKPQNHMALILFYDMASNYPLGWEIMPTENTGAISSALRRAIIRLGKMPQVAYLDNGRAFKARFFKGSNIDDIAMSGVYERLGIKTIHAWPYHGQSKTVERFFGSLAELERLCPTYTGTSIEKKPPRLNRGEKLHRKVHEKAFGGRCLTMAEAHMLIAAWFDEYAKRPQRGHLDGACPADVFTAGMGQGVDRAELDFLMMSMDVKRVHRNGITFQGDNYYHPALYGRKEGVVVRYDLQDLSALYLFEKDGTPIGVAEPVRKVHPAAAHLGDSADKQMLIEHIEARKSREKDASTMAREFLRDEVLPEHQRMLARNGVAGAVPTMQLPPPSTKVISFDVEKVARDVAEQERWQKEADDREARDSLLRLSNADRYERLMEMEAQGIELAEEWTGFMRFYEQTDEYAITPEYWESCRIKYGLMYRGQATGE